MKELACSLFVPTSVHYWCRSGAGAGACSRADAQSCSTELQALPEHLPLPKQRAVLLRHLKLQKQRKGGEASTASPKPQCLPKRNLLGLWRPSVSGHKIPLSSTWASLAAAFGKPKGWLPLELYPPLFLLLSCIDHLLLCIPVPLLT